MRDKKKFFNDIIKFYYTHDDKSMVSIKIVKIVDSTPNNGSNSNEENGDRNTEDSTGSNNNDRDSLGMNKKEHEQARSLNADERRQSMAILKAQMEQANPVNKWFGSIDYKPMSFGQYLDLLEYYLSMRDNLESSRSNSNTILLQPDWEEKYLKLCKRNQNWRDQIIKYPYMLLKTNAVDPSNSKDGNLESLITPAKISVRNIFIDLTIGLNAKLN